MKPKRNVPRLSTSKHDTAKKNRIAAIEGIRRGLESMKRNAGKPAEQFFREFFDEKDIPERERRAKLV